jgi:hypothetical protein
MWGDEMSDNRISKRLRRLTALWLLLLLAPATGQSVWGDELPSSASIQLQTPHHDSTPEPVTVFRWTRSQNPAVHSYRLIISDDPNLDSIVFELPEPGGSIIAPQAAVQLNSDLAVFEGLALFWRVLGLNQSGSPVEQSQEIFSFSFFTDQRGFTVISGLVQSDLNQLGLAGARVAVQGANAQTANSIVQTEFNGEYIVIALTGGITDDFEPDDSIGFPISIGFTKEGFKSRVLDDIVASERINGVITRNLTMIRNLPLSSSIQLQTPPHNSQPLPVTVFRWTRSQNPAVHSYRLIIAEEANPEIIVFELPEPGGSIIAPQAAVQLYNDPLAVFEGVPLSWRVLGLDQFGNPVEQSQEVFSFFFETFESGFTVISGLVQSDLNQLGLAGARVAVQGANRTANSIVQTEFNGEYIVIALTEALTDDLEPDDSIGFPISIAFTKEGFKSRVLNDIVASERINGVITRNLTMIRDGDGDGIVVVPALIPLLLGD